MLFSTGFFAQTIRGKVSTANDNPVPYATIQIGDNYGVITNEEGNFSIDIDGFKAEDSVAISCLGFEKSMLLLKDFSEKNYILKEQINELSEVFVTNKNLGIDSIMYYVKTNIDKNYNYKGNEYNIFSRKTEFIEGENANFEILKSTGFRKKQLESFNKDFDELETSLINNKSKQYTDFIGNLKVMDEAKTKLEIVKAIRLLDERNNQSFESLFEKGNSIVLKHLDKNKIYTVKSGLFKVSDSVSLDSSEEKMEDTISSLGHVKTVNSNILKDHSFINSNPKLDFVRDQKKYKYEIKDVTFLDNELVYIISFTPKRRSAVFSGTLYISNETFAVLRTEYKYYKNRVGQKFNLKLVLGVKYIEKNKKGFVAYEKHKNGYYYPKYISEKIDRYFYVNRPIKFIENNKRSNKVGFNFMIEGTFKEKTELLIVSRKDLDPSAYNSYKEKDKIEYETPKVYDASIWKDYNVLEPLNEMKAFNVSN